MSTQFWKNLSIDFVTGVSLSVKCKDKNYDLILVMINFLTKMIDYKPVKTIINAAGFVKVIIDIEVRHYGLLESIVSNRGSFFTSNFFFYYAIFMTSNRNFLSPSIHRQIARQRDKIV